MKKMLDLVVKEKVLLNQNYCLLKLSMPQGKTFPQIYPGQFVEVRVDNSPSTFLRRPISINFVDNDKKELWLLIQIIGEGTRRMSLYEAGETINLILPLGNSFTIPEDTKEEVLLIGGGVGIAPLLYLGKQLKHRGFLPKFLLGARSQKDLLLLDEFKKFGEVYCTTEDGSYGQKGFVINHSILDQINFDRIYTCGPKPMMVAIAKFAKNSNITCEVSLENMMACGIGACLCCVEKNSEGHHVCVCTEGPIFNINKLGWID